MQGERWCVWEAQCRKSSVLGRATKQREWRLTGNEMDYPKRSSYWRPEIGFMLGLRQKLKRDANRITLGKKRLEAHRSETPVVLQKSRPEGWPEERSRGIKWSNIKAYCASRWGVKTIPSLLCN